MKYSDNVDYIVGSIIYLGSHPHWWGRSVPNMSRALNLDATKLRAVFEGFPGLFRKSQTQDKNGEHFYGLQARYAQYPSKSGEEPNSEADIPVLDTDKQKLLLEFVHKMMEHEKSDMRAYLTQGVAVLALVVATVTAIFVKKSGG